MNEKEKKSRTKKTVTKATQSIAAELNEPKKTRKKANQSIDASVNRAELKKIAGKMPLSKVTEMKVSHEEIARLAHRYWAERGGQHGHHEEDWLRAERELLSKAS